MLNDDTQVKCYALESRAAHGENVAEAARALLVDPRNYGDGCVDLITSLAINQQFTNEDVWQQIRIAYEQNQTNTGSKLLDALGNQRPDPDLFNQADEHAAAAARARRRRRSAIASARAARDHADGAQRSGHGGGDVCIGRAVARHARARDRLGHDRVSGGGQADAGRRRLVPASANAPLSTPAYEWRTRVALLAGDWTMVRWSTEQMPAALRSQPAWVYWHARALKQGGDTAQANQEFEQIAQGFNFYGQLASEELGQKIVVPPKTAVSDAEVQQAANTPGFALAQRFYQLNLRLEGNRE